MKAKRYTTTIIIVLLVSIFVTTGVALAASRDFTYNFKHQITISKISKATKNKATITCYTTSNKSKSKTFTVEQYQKGVFSAKRVGKGTITCTKKGDSVTFSTKKGEKYTYEFWKKQDGKAMLGSGRITY